MNVVYDKYNINTERLTSDVYALIKGMKYGTWINGRTAAVNSLIENPSGIVESILRDWCFRVDNARTSTSGTGTTFVLTDPEISMDDYFNGSYVYSSSGWESTVSDYNGTTKQVTINTSETIASTNRLYFTNVLRAGAVSIDTTLFDSFYSDRSGWKFKLGLIDQTLSSSVLNDILFESFAIMTKQYNKYKIFPLDVKSTVGTFSSPVMGKNGLPKINTYLTPLSYVYNSFQLDYAYDIASGEYKKTLKTDKNGSTGSVISSGYLTKCANASVNNKLSKQFKYQSKLVDDDTTAIYIMQKFIDKLTTRHLMVEYQGDFSSHCQYEIGDQVLINHPMIPIGLKNSAEFIIYDTNYSLDSENAKITFKLMQLPNATVDTFRLISDGDYLTSDTTDYLADGV